MEAFFHLGIKTHSLIVKRKHMRFKYNLHLAGGLERMKYAQSPNRRHH
jgi:hypothetical protein